ncbi:DUF748 domain-containing protein [Arcobacter roscoffensis]|uniref:DUF748 domain-containing protein n=1 Tax=Arcobacter roscoffensis TaxID=2961520 RepID=A0ABY5E6P4_9BACT|nr:DUF748 domain-containing protein [Arcobacter roscoffensis]UTJ07817.1 DUF748 domain-containing protein [Arcobacter roscoffensis]
MSRFDKIFYTIVISLSIYVTVGFKLIPYVVEDQLVKNLDKTLTLKSHVKKVDFNPFTFHAKIHDFRLGDYEKPTVSFEEFAFDFGGFKSLFNLHVNVENVLLKNAFIDVVQQKDGTINLTKLLKEKKEEPKKQEETKSENDIKFLVSKISLVDSKINYTKIKDKKPFLLTLDNINYELYDLGSFENPLSSNNFSLKINENAKLLIKGAFRLEPFTMYGKASLENLELAKLLEYEKEMLNFTLDKKAKFDTIVNFDITTKDEFNLELFTDKLKLSNLNINSQKQDIFKLDSFDIKRVDLNLKNEDLKVSDVTLSKPIINLLQNKDGLNITKLVNTNDKKEEKKKESKPNNWKVNVSNIKLANASLNFKDTINNLEVKNPNFSFNTNSINIKDSKIDLNNLTLNNPKLSFVDKKNRLNVDTKNLNIKLNDLALIDNKIAIDKLGITKESLSLKDRKNAMYINTNKASINLSNIKVADGKTSVNSINSMIKSIALNQAREKQKININNLGLDINSINLNGENISVSKAKIAKPSIKLANQKSNSQINARNIELSLNGISKNAKLIRVKQLRLNEPNLSIYNTKEKTKINTSNIDVLVKDIKSYTNGLLSVASTDIINPKVSISLPKKSSSSTKSKKVVKQEKEPKAKSNAKLNIGPVNIKNASLAFEDKSLPLPFKTTVSKLNGQISELDTTKASKTRLKVNGVVDKYGTTKITGVVNPNDIKILTDVNMVFKNISMKNFTPYTSKFIGKELDSGKLDLDLKYNIQKSDLDAKNSIVITKIELGKDVKSDDAVSLPLGLAIALLEDSNGVIDLDIPVSGNVDDPKFQIGSVVWKAFTNLITKAITAPFSLLGAMFGFDEDEIKSVNFDFAKSEITPIQKETLDKISKILNKRPNLALKLVGSYDETKDMYAMKKASFEKQIKTKIPNDQIRDYEKRYLEVMMSMYKKFDKKLSSKKSFTKDGKLNQKEYSNYLEKNLISKQNISKKDLEKMAKNRVLNIKEYLTKTKKIKASQIIISDKIKVKTQSKKTSNIDLKISQAK